MEMQYPLAISLEISLSGEEFTLRREILGLLGRGGLGK